MDVAIISHLYPTELTPHRGKFIQDNYELIHNNGAISADLYIPTPHSIPYTQRRRANSAQLLTSSAKRVSYLSFPRKSFPSLIRASLSARLISTLSEKHYDLLHIHWLYPDALAIPALSNAGLPCVLTIHGSDWYQTYNRSSIRPHIAEIFEHCAYVLFSGPRLREDVIAEYPGIKDRSAIIYNMVNEHRYTLSDPESKAEYRQKLDWDKTKIHVLTVANLRPEKGIDILIRAIQSLRNMQDVHFHIIGATEPGEYLDQIHQLSKGIPNLFFHEPVPPEQLIPYYHSADLFLLPSRREGFNVALLEAMSCGLPVVCTRAGGNAELVNEQTGIICDPEDSTGLADSINEGLSRIDQFDPATIRRSVTERFGTAPYAERLIAVYNEVLGEQK